MAGDAADFTLQLGKVAEVQGMRIDTVKKLLAFKLYAMIVQRTPVDTGRARAAWNIAVNAADTSVPPEREKTKGADGKTLNSGGDLTGEEAGKNGALLDSDLLDPIFITNSLDYIQYLEGGSSKQAPAGMVMLSVQAIVGETEIIIAKAVADNPLK